MWPAFTSASTLSAVSQPPLLPALAVAGSCEPVLHRLAARHLQIHARIHRGAVE